MRRPLACLLAAVATAVSACASAPVTTPSPTAPPAVRPTATPTPAPDTERVVVVSEGLGVYQAVVVPVAVLHNAATRTGVSGLVVHFLPTRGGVALTPLDSPAVTLYPGQTLAVTADCTDSCNNTGTSRDPDGLTVTVGPGTWAPLPGAALAAGAVSFACKSGCSGGHGQWDVATTIGSPELSQGSRVDLFTWCTNAAGAILGGNPPSVVVWPQTGGTLSHTLHAILSGPPAACRVGASASI
ncbi:MAG TPA: hypothetical protein VIG86_02245 [Candidatus Dormibacteraeota bacterium]|jgi:hypothetical protein